MEAKISIHRPSKQLLNSESLFGYYLAGLIDGDGHISKIGHIVISFNKRDLKDAYWLRTKIGFGKVREVKYKNAVNLIISNKTGVSYISKIIHNKLKHPTRIEQYNSRLWNVKTSTDTTINWESPWFAGFCDADGHLRIHTLYRQHRKRDEVRLLCQIDQKSDILLKQFKFKFGGYLGYRSKQDTFYYSTVSYKGMFLLLKYLDKYSLFFYKLT